MENENDLSVKKADIKSLVNSFEGEEKEKAINLLLRIGLGSIVSGQKESKKVIQLYKPRIKNIPKEYDLIAEIKCQICGTVMEQYFHMTWDDERHALIAINLPSKPQGVYKTLKSTNYQCFHCYTVLIQMEKDELIKKIFMFSRKSHLGESA